MERKQIIVLIVISFLLCNVVAFLDEGIKTFNYLTHLGDWITLIIYAIIFLIFPLILFYSYKISKFRFLISMIGFAPILFLISIQLG